LVDHTVDTSVPSPTDVPARIIPGSSEPHRDHHVEDHALEKRRLGSHESLQDFFPKFRIDQASCGSDLLLRRGRLGGRLNGVRDARGHRYSALPLPELCVLAQRAGVDGCGLRCK